jgi:hypothetical protein
MAWVAPWVFAALWLVGCVTARVPVLGSSPNVVIIEVGSTLLYEPYRADELAHPVIRDSVARCEQLKEPRCRDRITGVETSTTFARSETTRIVTLVVLRGLEAGRRYDVRGRLFDPRGDTRARMTVAYDLPPSPLPEGFDLKVHFHWVVSNPPSRDLGRWRVEVTVNGNVEGERTFEIVESGTAPA